MLVVAAVPHAALGTVAHRGEQTHEGVRVRRLIRMGAAAVGTQAEAEEPARATTEQIVSLAQAAWQPMRMELVIGLDRRQQMEAFEEVGRLEDDFGA